MVTLQPIKKKAASVEPERQAASLQRSALVLEDNRSSVPALQLVKQSGNAYALSKPKAFKASRKDAKGLGNHIQSLQEQFYEGKKIQTSITKAKKAPSSTAEKKRRKKLLAAKRNMTEAIGEMNATNAILKDTNWKLTFGFAKGVGYDQVWEKPNGTIAVVEAKGPGAKLGVSDAKGKQMSQSWVEGTAKSMAGSTDVAKQQIGNSILNAIKNGHPKVVGYTVHSTATGKQAQSNWMETEESYN